MTTFFIRSLISASIKINNIVIRPLGYAFIDVSLTDPHTLLIIDSLHDTKKIYMSEANRRDLDTMLGGDEPSESTPPPILVNLSDFELVRNKVNVLTTRSSTQYPTTKAVLDYLDAFQPSTNPGNIQFTVQQWDVTNIETSLISPIVGTNSLYQNGKLIYRVLQDSDYYLSNFYSYNTNTNGINYANGLVTYNGLLNSDGTSSINFLNIRNIEFKRNETPLVEQAGSSSFILTTATSYENMIENIESVPVISVLCSKDFSGVTINIHNVTDSDVNIDQYQNKSILSVKFIKSVESLKIVSDDGTVLYTISKSELPSLNLNWNLLLNIGENTEQDKVSKQYSYKLVEYIDQTSNYMILNTVPVNGTIHMTKPTDSTYKYTYYFVTEDNFTNFCDVGADKISGKLVITGDNAQLIDTGTQEILNVYTNNAIDLIFSGTSITIKNITTSYPNMKAVILTTEKINPTSTTTMPQVDLTYTGFNISHPIEAIVPSEASDGETWQIIGNGFYKDQQLSEGSYITFYNNLQNIIVIKDVNGLETKLSTIDEWNVENFIDSPIKPVVSESSSYNNGVLSTKVIPDSDRYLKNVVNQGVAQYVNGFMTSSSQTGTGFDYIYVPNIKDGVEFVKNLDPANYSSGITFILTQGSTVQEVGVTKSSINIGFDSTNGFSLTTNKVGIGSNQETINFSDFKYLSFQPTSREISLKYALSKETAASAQMRNIMFTEFLDYSPDLPWNIFIVFTDTPVNGQYPFSYKADIKRYVNINTKIMNLGPYTPGKSISWSRPTNSPVVALYILSDVVTEVTEDAINSVGTAGAVADMNGLEIAIINGVPNPTSIYINDKATVTFGTSSLTVGTTTIPLNNPKQLIFMLMDDTTSSVALDITELSYLTKAEALLPAGASDGKSYEVVGEGFWKEYSLVNGSIVKFYDNLSKLSITITTDYIEGRIEEEINKNEIKLNNTISSSISSLTTSVIPEGDNKYWTDGKFDVRLSGILNNTAGNTTLFQQVSDFVTTKIPPVPSTTDQLIEGSGNKYYAYQRLLTDLAYLMNNDIANPSDQNVLDFKYGIEGIVSSIQPEQTLNRQIGSGYIGSQSSAPYYVLNNIKENQSGSADNISWEWTGSGIKPSSSNTPGSFDIFVPTENILRGLYNLDFTLDLDIVDIANGTDTELDVGISYDYYSGNLNSKVYFMKIRSPGNGSWNSTWYYSDGSSISQAGSAGTSIIKRGPAMYTRYTNPSTFIENETLIELSLGTDIYNSSNDYLIFPRIFIRTVKGSSIAIKNIYFDISKTYSISHVA